MVRAAWPRRVADRHHPAVLDRNRTLHTRPPTAVKDEAALNLQIVVHRDLLMAPTRVRR